MNYPIKINEINKIALNFNCWVSDSGILFYCDKSNKKFKHAGKFYFKETTGFFHITDVYYKKYPGGKNLKELFSIFCKNFKFK